MINEIFAITALLKSFAARLDRVILDLERGQVVEALAVLKAIRKTMPNPDPANLAAARTRVDEVLP